MQPVTPENSYCSPATYRQRLEQALTTLRGMLEGVSIDSLLNQRERDFLTQWMDEHQRLVNQPTEVAKDCPWLRGLFPAIVAAGADGVITAEEQADLLDHIDQVRETLGRFFDDTTHLMQELHGLLGGIAADGVIAERELRGLQAWIDDHDTLHAHWPFTEVDALITSVLADGVIDADEHHRLLEYFAGFVAIGDQRVLPRAVTSITQSDFVAACDPSIVFKGRQFCVSGASAKAARKVIHGHITARGGIVHPRITDDLSYLVYCDAGSPCWAYNCYGRKVEDVVARRKAGATMLIVREADFWDAVADHRPIA